MELSKANQIQRMDSTVSGFDPETEGQVVTAVAAMHANLHTFGKPWSPAVAQGWLMVLRASADVKANEFLGAVVWFTANRKDFPAPSEVLLWIRENREDTELQARLEQAVISQREDDEKRIDAKAMRIFGTSEPTPKQWREYLAGRADEGIQTKPSRGMSSIAELGLAEACLDLDRAWREKKTQGAGE